MGDRYWEGHRDGGADMRERCAEWRANDKAELKSLRESLDGCCEKVRNLAEQKQSLTEKIRRKSELIEALNGGLTNIVEVAATDALGLLHAKSIARTTLDLNLIDAPASDNQEAHGGEQAESNDDLPEFQKLGRFQGISKGPAKRLEPIPIDDAAADKSTSHSVEFPTGLSIGDIVMFGNEQYEVGLVLVGDKQPPKLESPLGRMCTQYDENQLGHDPAADRQPRSVVDGRRIDSSIANFERRALLCIDDEQQKLNADNALIAVLCDAIRLGREYADSVGFVEIPTIDKQEWSSEPPTKPGYYWARLPLTADVSPENIKHLEPEIVKVLATERSGFLGFHKFYRRKRVSQKSILAKEVLWGEPIAPVATRQETE